VVLSCANHVLFALWHDFAGHVLHRILCTLLLSALITALLSLSSWNGLRMRSDCWQSASTTQQSTGNAHGTVGSDAFPCPTISMQILSVLQAAWRSARRTTTLP
jgi:hypothetical protein